MLDMNERRLLQRTRLALYLDVTDNANGESLGHIIDINVCGFLLLSKAPLQVGDVYRVNIQIPDTEPEGYASCEAIVRRCDTSVNPSFYEIAFEISQLSADNRKLIDDLEHTLLLKFGQ